MEKENKQLKWFDNGNHKESSNSPESPLGSEKAQDDFHFGCKCSCSACPWNGIC